jgi:hypothetical protein
MKTELEILNASLYSAKQTQQQLLNASCALRRARLENELTISRINARISELSDVCVGGDGVVPDGAGEIAENE